MIVYTDGGYKPKDGAYGSCRLETDEGELIQIIRWRFQYPVSTNNEAEYATLLETVKYLSDISIDEPLTIYSDSQLMIKQLNGEYTINKDSLRDFAEKILEILKDFGTTTLSHVPRKIIVAKLGH